jgi:hypothetical protein
MSQGIAVAVTNSNTKEDKPLPAKRSTQWPDNLRITEMHRMYAITKGVADPDEMWGHFENHHKAKGSRFLDWDRAWFTWVANSKRFGGVRGASQQQKSSEVYVGTGPSLPPDRPPNQKVIERLRKNREAEAARNSGAATGRLEREAGAGARIG